MYHHFFLNLGQPTLPQVNIDRQVQFFQFSLRFPFSLSIKTSIQEWKCLQNFWCILQLVFLFRSSPDWHPVQTPLPPRETCPIFVLHRQRHRYPNAVWHSPNTLSVYKIQRYSGRGERKTVRTVFPD